MSMMYNDGSNSLSNDTSFNRQYILRNEKKKLHFLFSLPLSSGLGAGELQSWVNIPLSLVFILPLVRDLIGAVEAICVGIIHNSSVETSNHLGDDPLDVVHDGVGVGVWGDVLVVGGLPEGDHVLPDGSINSVTRKYLIKNHQKYLKIISYTPSL